MNIPALAVSERRKRLVTILTLIGIFLLAAVLRFYRLGEKTIWLDEGFSIWMGSQTVPELIRLVIDIDQHPPLYYLLLHVWMQIGGTGAFWVRAFSAVVGLLAIPVMYLAGRRLSDERTGLIAAFILAINPFQVVYSQEARTYALLTLNASLALYLTIRLLTDENARSKPIGAQFKSFFKTWRKVKREAGALEGQAVVGYQQDWVKTPTQRGGLSLEMIQTDLTWLGYMVFTAGTVYCHNTAVFFPIGVNLFVLGLMIWQKLFWRRFFRRDSQGLQPPSFSNWFWAQVGVALVWSPWLVAFFAQASGVYGEFWIPKPTLEIVLNTLQSFFSDFLPGNMALRGVAWWFFVAMLALGVVHFRKRLLRGWLLIVVFSAPFLGELLVSIWRPIFYVRTLIWAPIPLYLLMAAGIRQLHFRPYILTALGILAVVNGFSLREFYFNYQKEAWDEAAAYVARNVQDGDILIFNAGWTQIPFDYYFENYHKSAEKFGAPQTMFEWGVLEPRMSESDVPRLRSILRGRQRVWLVYSHNWYTDPKSLVIDTTREELEQLRHQTFLGIEIYLFGVR